MERENSSDASPGTDPGAVGSLSTPGSRAQEIKERQLQGPVGGETAITDPQFVARGLNSRAMRFELAEILLARGGGINIEVAPRFDVVKERGLVEIEAHFRRVEQVKEENFMPASAQT